VVIPAEVRQLLADEELGAHITVLDGEAVGAHAAVSYERGWLTAVPSGFDADDLLADARALIDREQNRRVDYGLGSVFMEVLAPPPSLVIFGAVHAAQALSNLGDQLGYRVTVVDARSAFLTEERFPRARRLIGWPGDVVGDLTFDRRTFVVLLSHDARFEDPVWPLVADADVKYLGAMGSRRTHASRVDKLRAAGWSEEQIGRIHGPVGLDLGGESPEETAVSILAEMIQVRYGAGSGLSLRGQAGRIHRQRSEES
jgi:xanthine dehydrogenase accessory factor